MLHHYLEAYKTKGFAHGDIKVENMGIAPGVGI
jgi:hypothetical protein